ncbi:MAG: hypothetical protein KAS32_10795 [Candidatus Peribacteraceae bacterium]|nr:hypothetical protein [Candidatus Peribacteraceae bacterium]
MSDLIVYLPAHGYADDTPVYISWLNDEFFISDKDNDSFKLAITAGGAVLVQFDTTIIDGFVRETDAAIGSTTISGLEYLEGKTVSVVSNGRIIDTVTVSGGEITISSDVTLYSVGLIYVSTVQPMKLDVSGTGVSTTKKLSRTVLTLHETIGGKIGPSTTNMDNIVYREAGEGGDEFPYFTGDLEVSLPGGYSRGGDIVITQNQPLPMTVLALTIDVGASND